MPLVHGAPQIAEAMSVGFPVPPDHARRVASRESPFEEHLDRVVKKRCAYRGKKSSDCEAAGAKILEPVVKSGSGIVIGKSRVDLLLGESDLACLLELAPLRVGNVEGWHFWILSPSSCTAPFNLAPPPRQPYTRPPGTPGERPPSSIGSTRRVRPGAAAPGGCSRTRARVSRQWTRSPRRTTVC